ncbi:Oidioi.mRNA.OKI2018_I69.chr1.g702.t1.cds [Oikopleura dioica]|uniref:Oidioi.mRNA.OKI2018_I69.chr1.g702.t1.cds n=1 Tax=Oikopleura dioica TaxID=34765 RepID=A0ABN7SKP6_OIKDI|nr:Oidioi.mRNA.OKI2018_I69.chr1.g702.t1.cds [Oikopleura dioica]
MAPWFVASVRAGDYAYKKHDARVNLFNGYQYQLEQIRTSKFYSGYKTKLTRKQWADTRPSLEELLSATSKVFPLFRTTSMSSIERCILLSTQDNLKYEFLHNIGETLRETLEMEEKYVKLQTKMTTHIHLDCYTFAQEANLSAPVLD